LSHISITLYVCYLFFHNKSNLLGLNFHHFLLFFCFLCKLLFLQVYVLPSVCFCNCWFCRVLFHLFVVKFILVSFFFFLHNVYYSSEGRYINCCSEWFGFGIRNVALKTMVLNRYGTFDQIANTNMEDPSYAYLYCDLLNKIVLTKSLWRWNHLI